MSPPVTRLLLVRHGHIDLGPPPGRLCGWLDVPLSHEGLAALDALRRRRARLPAPVALYSSPLLRARVVAETLGGLWHLTPHLDDDLREIHCGALEGAAIPQVELRHSDLWARNLAQSDETFAWPGGESYRDFRVRVLGGLARIADEHPGDRVAVVTHAGVVTQVLGAVRGRSPAVWEADRPAPLSATEVTWGNGGPDALLGFSMREWL